MHKWTALTIALGLLASHASASDFASQREHNWHQWRGPFADGTAKDADPPLEWAEDKNVKWKVELPGKGSSTPIVWNDRIFVLTAIQTDRKAERQQTAAAEQPRDRPQGRRGGRRRGRFGGGGPPTNYYEYVVICLDRKNGKTIWQQVAADALPHEGHHGTNTFASGSPITDGRFVYASFGSRGIYCYDLAGELQWSQDLGDMQTRNGFGEGATPTLHGETLIVPWDHEGPSFVAALDATTGEERWRVDRDERTTWATPLVVEHGGRTQLIMNGSNRVRSYDLTDGSLIWQCGGQASNPIPSPLVADGLVYCTTGYRGFAVSAIPVDSSGDITDTDEVAWHRQDTGSYIASPVVYKGLLYHTKDRNAILTCLDASTGETVINQKRLPIGQAIYASPVAVADRLYFTGRNGKTVVIQHGRQLKVLATNELEEGIDASPAVVGKELFLRGEKHLYCLSSN